MREIDFFLIGAQKAGTTSLYRTLRKHPQLFLPYDKELRVFIRTATREMERQILRVHYKDAPFDRMLGLSFVQLLFLPEAPGRIHGHNPAAKLVAVLRDPVDRAYSAYWQAVRDGWETHTFEEAIDLELNGELTGFREHLERSYLAHSCYADQLERYLYYFDRDQILVILNEDLADAASVLREFSLWMGLEPAPADWIGGSPRRNVARLPRHRWLHYGLSSPHSFLKKGYRRLVPPAIRKFLRKRVVDRILDWNLREHNYPPMDTETRERLREFFRPENKRLSDLIARDVSHWSQ